MHQIQINISQPKIVETLFERLLDAIMVDPTKGQGLHRSVARWVGQKVKIRTATWL
jgi:hypothetical protein